MEAISQQIASALVQNFGSWLGFWLGWPPKRASALKPIGLQRNRHPLPRTLLRRSSAVVQPTQALAWAFFSGPPPKQWRSRALQRRNLH